MNHKPLHITCSAFKLQRIHDKVQLILEEFNSPSEPAIPSTQKGWVKIYPRQHFPPILTHQGGSWSVSPKHGQYLLLTDQQSRRSSEMRCPFPNYCHSPRYVLWETPFSTIQGSSPCSNWRITFGLENRIPVHEQEREWIHGARHEWPVTHSDPAPESEAKGQLRVIDLFWEGLETGLPEDGQEVVSGRKSGLWLCIPLGWNLLWDPGVQSSGRRRQEKYRRMPVTNSAKLRPVPAAEGNSNCHFLSPPVGWTWPCPPNVLLGEGTKVLPQQILHHQEMPYPERTGCCSFPASPPGTRFSARSLGTATRPGWRTQPHPWMSQTPVTETHSCSPRTIPPVGRLSSNPVTILGSEQFQAEYFLTTPPLLSTDMSVTYLLSVRNCAPSNMKFSSQTR